VKAKRNINVLAIAQPVQKFSGVIGGKAGINVNTAPKRETTKTANTEKIAVFHLAHFLWSW